MTGGVGAGSHPDVGHGIRAGGGSRPHLHESPRGSSVDGRVRREAGQARAGRPAQLQRHAWLCFGANMLGAVFALVVARRPIVVQRHGGFALFSASVYVSISIAEVLLQHQIRTQPCAHPPSELKRAHSLALCKTVSSSSLPDSKQVHSLSDKPLTDHCCPRLSFIFLRIPPPPPLPLPLSCCLVSSLAGTDRPRRRRVPP